MLSYVDPPAGAPRRRARAALPWLLIGALLTGACDARPRYYIDASTAEDAAGPWPDAVAQVDGGAEIFAGLTVTGCAEQEVTADTFTCRGTVPLTLSFSSLAPPNASTFKWEFGDDSPDGATPSIDHVYEQVGTFTVVLTVAGPFGSIQPPQLTQIVVSPAEPGGYCEEDAQCGDGWCLCGSPAEPTCPTILQGTCAADCPSCPADNHCVDLEVQGTSEPDAWRTQACQPGCETDDDCTRSGFRCRELPTVEAPAGRQWQPICFPEVLADVGGSCHDATDLADPALCLSGACAELGRFGLCTEDCNSADCPSYATCVSFLGGPHVGAALCLARCSQDRPCTDDPQLACEAPDTAGDLGFVLLDPSEPSGNTYCAPRRCATDQDCPTVDCDLASGGFCL